VHDDRGALLPTAPPARPLLAALTAAAALLALPLAPAAAATAPEEAGATTYWGSFLVEDGAWAFAPVGPSGRPAVDGTVEGLRLATVADDAEPRPPRDLPSFDALCADVAPAEGEVRVGVVVDAGRPADLAALPGAGTPPDAPRGACAQVPEGSVVTAALEDVAALRVEGGVLCAVDGLPRDVCQPAVALPEAAVAPDEPVDVVLGAAPAVPDAAPAEEPSTLAGPLGLAGALAAALALSAGVAVAARALLRRRGAARR
jgi:hypothetical protein